MPSGPLGYRASGLSGHDLKGAVYRLARGGLIVYRNLKIGHEQKKG